MDIEFLTSAAFWEGDGHFAARGLKEALVALDGCGGSVMFQTSGSTGEKRWMVLEKRAMRVSARAVNQWLEVGQDSRWGLALPLDHVGGFAILTRCFEAGCHISAFQEKWAARAFVQWVRDECITHVSLVPTQLHDLVAARLAAPECLEAVVIGGGRLSVELGQGGRDLAWPVLASYGMTEAGSQIATQRLDDLGKPFSEGNMEILPIWEVGLTAEGLLRLRGDALFSGTVEGGSFHKRDDAWFTTSDRVAVSGNTVAAIGRADSLVKVMGELVDLEEVGRRVLEIADSRIPAERFAVIALPDARREHLLAAVFEGEAQPDLIAEYNQKVSGVERIGESFSIPRFPRSSLGKLRRGKLVGICAPMRSN